MTLTYENETSTIDGFAESAQSQWIAAVSDRCERDARRVAGGAGWDADLLQILFVDRAVGAPLCLLRLSGVGVSSVSRRGSARRHSRHDRAALRCFRAGHGGPSGAGRRRGAARAPRIRPGPRVPSPLAGHVGRRARGYSRRSGRRRSLTGSLRLIGLLSISPRATPDHDRARRSPEDDHKSQAHIRYCGRTDPGRRGHA